MIVYRLYTLDRNGKVSPSPRIVECKDDKDALEVARQQLDGHDIEIWRDNKRVGLIAHKPGSGEAPP